MKTLSVSLFFFILLSLLVISVCYCSDTSLVYDFTLTYESQYWYLGTWGEGVRTQWQNGVAYISLNNTDGQWIGGKIQQGSLPHGWTQAHPLKENPIINRKTKITVYIRFKVANISFYRNGYVNLGVSFWIQRPNTVWESQQPQIEIGFKLLWIRYNDGNLIFQSNPVHFQGDLGNDYHSLFDVYYESNSLNNTWISYAFETQPYISNALDYWNVKEGVIKNIEVYFETNAGKGEAWIDEINVILTENNSNSFLDNEFLLSILLFAVCIIVFYSFIKKY